MKTAVRVESYGDTLGAPAGLERGAFPLKTGGERYKRQANIERPKGANSRRSGGPWERDLMVGKNHKSAVLVVTDRKSRFNKHRKLNGKHAKKVTRETAKALKGLPIKTMSNDRGQEFSDHQNYEKKSKVKVYFVNRLPSPHIKFVFNLILCFQDMTTGGVLNGHGCFKEKDQYVQGARGPSANNQR
jgi:hypothetical protein